MMTSIIVNPCQEKHITSAQPVDYDIVHQIPGRLRIRIPRLAWDSDYVRRLERLIHSSKLIAASRINPAALSLIVSYQSDENISESVLLNNLHAFIQEASPEKETDCEVSSENQQNLWLPAVGLLAAISAVPLEIPFFLVAGLVVAWAIPLWQRSIDSGIKQGQITVDSLDAVWLTAQLLQCNAIAAALFPYLSEVSEALRRNKLEQLENELIDLFKLEEKENPQLWASSFAPIKEAEKEKWMQSVEDTALIGQVKPIAQGLILPTLLASAMVGIVTNDLVRASAMLPLDIGVALRGVTPLAIVTALAAAARAGVYIPDGKTLERLAQVDTIVLDQQSLNNLIISNIRQENPIFEIQIITDYSQDNVKKNSVNAIHLTTESQTVNQVIDELRSQGRIVAWVDDAKSNRFEPVNADMIISLARSDHQKPADVILHHEDLSSVFYTFNLARYTLSTAYQSLAIAIIPNLLTVGVGVLFGLDPILAVLINGTSVILAELNTLKPFPRLLARDI